jgi:hypothetical protein
VALFLKLFETSSDKMPKNEEEKSIFFAKY